MSREPVATHRIAHVSDSHLTAGGAMREVLRPAATYSAALAALEGSRIPFDALVHTGDIADEGEAQAYVAVRSVTDEVVERTGWPVLWAPGNHDVRAPLREHLLGSAASDEPLDHARTVDGLRIVVLDTSIPARGEGGVDEAQLGWLRTVLAAPAQHGTVLALHHPPVPIEVTGLQRLPLTDQEALADVLRGSDVRAILAGHLHYATTSTFAGIPVFVAPALAYTVRATAPQGGIISLDAGRGAGIMSLYDDGRVGWTLLPTEPSTVLGSVPDAALYGMGVDVER